MDGAILLILFFALLIGAPILLPIVVVKLTSWETDEVPDSPSAPAARPSATEPPRMEIAPTSPEEFAQNPFRPPKTRLEDAETYDNNSGGGSAIVPPRGIKGWSLGPFVFNGFWALFNNTWIGLLCLLVYVPSMPFSWLGFLFWFYLAIRGRELAWRNKRWDSLEYFNRVQKRWSVAAYVLIGLAFAGSLISTIAAYYTQHR